VVHFLPHVSDRRLHRPWRDRPHPKHCERADTAALGAEGFGRNLLDLELWLDLFNVVFAENELLLDFPEHLDQRSMAAAA